METPIEKMQRLRALVIMELDETDQPDKPNVFLMYHDPETKEGTITYVIDKVIADDLTISGALVDIEREYNINLQND